MNEWRRGPCCTACGGGSSRAVRTHSANIDNDTIYYLTYVWACLVCGREWLDESLERLNDWAAYSAFLTAAGRDGGPVHGAPPPDLVASYPQACREAVMLP